MFLTGFTPNLVILSLHLKEEWRWKAIQNHIFSIGQTSTCKTLEHFGIDVKKQHTASWMLNFFCNLRFVQWNGISSNTFWNSFLVNDHQQCIFDGPWCHFRIHYPRQGLEVVRVPDYWTTGSFHIQTFAWMRHGHLCANTSAQDEYFRNVSSILNSFHYSLVWKGWINHKR